MIIPLLQNATEGLLHLFYPQLCVFCNRSLNRDERTLCLHCILKLPRTNFHAHVENKASDIFIGRLPIVNTTSFVYFTKDGMIQDLLHSFKYEGKQELGRLFGMLLATELKECNWTNDIDAIVPIPLHKKKERKRGFNQAVLFADGIAETLNIPVVNGAVIRTKFTASQTTKSRIERIENVTDAFAVKNKESIKGKHLLLVDDVLTTGATIESCALELLKVEGVKVSIATIALARD